ncbi:MAG: ribulokinase [Planctomycetota bacterium]
MPRRFALGIDYGTESGRALLVDAADGTEIATAVAEYEHGRRGVVLSSDPNLARQHPADYLTCAATIVPKVLRAAKRKVKGLRPEQVIGIGVDTTGSTPLPVDRDGRPLAMQRKLAKDPAALAWLWKDHTPVAEAAEITALACQMRPQYLARCGGTYSSEWFFSKILHCLRTSPAVFDAAYTWVECADWIPAVLTGTEHPDRLKIGVCAAGHKAMFNADWGGYPDAEFLGRLDPKMADLRARLPERAYTIEDAAGGLSPEWGKRFGLPPGTPVAIGAIDAHLGAVGAGIAPGTLVKIIGTSTCDMLVAPANQPLPDVPGVCGIVRGSIVPGYFGLEAGQPAVGDIFNWFVDYVQPGGPKVGTHAALTAAAARLRPGASGLLALDWNNGNRSLLVDPRLTGLLLGQTLYTTPAEIYRALIEATAFGALTIVKRFEEYGLAVEQIVNCGGIAEKNPLVMQIYADVTGRPMRISRSQQTCALGAAIAGAVVGSNSAEPVPDAPAPVTAPASRRRFTARYADVPAAQRAMTGLKRTVYRPNPQAHATYQQLYTLYRRLHDAFGTPGWQGNLFDVMKKLLEIRAAARG